MRRQKVQDTYKITGYMEEDARQLMQMTRSYKRSLGNNQHKKCLDTLKLIKQFSETMVMFHEDMLLKER